MATTTPDNIWTPDAGDDYDFTTDIARTADDVQDALNNVRKGGVPAVSDQASQDALFPSPVSGNRVYRTDLGLELAYVSDLAGGNWVPTSGVRVVRPNGIVGGSLLPDGSISFSGAANPEISGLFSGTASSYRVSYRGATSVALQLRTVGGTSSTTDYNFQRHYATGSSSFGDTFSGQSSLQVWTHGGNNFWAEVRIILPAAGVPTCFSVQSGSSAGSALQGTAHIEGIHASSTAFDGLRIVGTPNAGALLRVIREG